MKTAVLLCSMGGPESLKAVRPFLFNLFYDPAILRCANPLRWVLASLISTRRANVARSIYQKLGGSSPLVQNTRDQAEAIEKKLLETGAFRCFIGMSYSKPFICETMKEIKDYRPDHLIVVPLYPQFSTTTSQSVFQQVELCMAQLDMKVSVSGLPSFQTERGFIEALCCLMKPVISEAEKYGKPRVLCSAHGLPQSIVKGGDPYQFQCEETVDAVLNMLGADAPDHVLCYQSKVGRKEWIGPSTESEVKKASQAKRPIVVVPIAFVSEHAETLVELGMEYKKIAQDLGAPFFVVVPTVSTNPIFIEGLSRKIAEINQNSEKT